MTRRLLTIFVAAFLIVACHLSAQTEQTPKAPAPTAQTTSSLSTPVNTPAASPDITSENTISRDKEYQYIKDNLLQTYDSMKHGQNMQWYIITALIGLFGVFGYNTFSQYEKRLKEHFEDSKERLERYDTRFKEIMKDAEKHCTTAKELSDTMKDILMKYMNENKSLKNEMTKLFDEFIAEAGAKVDKEIKAFQIEMMIAKEKFKLLQKEMNPALKEELEDTVKHITEKPPEERSARDYFLMAYNSKDVNEQIEYYSEAININHRFASAYYNRGLAYDELAKDDSKYYDDAIADYDNAIRIAPDDTDAYYNKACSYIVRNKVGDIEKAFEMLDKAAEKGFDEYELVLRDEELDKIRKDERFKTFLNKVEENQKKTRRE